MHIREVRSRAWKRWTSAKFHVANPEKVRQILLDIVERRTSGAWAIAWLIDGERVTEAELWARGEDPPLRGDGSPQLVEVVTAEAADAHNRERAEENGGDGTTQTITVAPSKRKRLGTLARRLREAGAAEDSNQTRTLAVAEPAWQVRRIGEVQTEIGKEWGISRAVFRKMYQKGVKHMAWGVAERMLRDLDPETRAEMEGALFRPDEKKARDEYVAAAESAIERLGFGRDPEVHVVKWTPAQKRRVDIYEGEIARWGVPAVRGQLMHFRVWDRLMTFPRLLNLNTKGQERLLSQLYEGEMDTIGRELQVYRDMAPLAPHPPFLAEREVKTTLVGKKLVPPRRPKAYAPRQRVEPGPATGTYTCPVCGYRSSELAGHSRCLAGAKTVL